MSFVTKALSRPLTRAFHSPYAVLGTSPLNAPTTIKDFSSQYEKQYDQPHEPSTSYSGYRTYVVSEPDASYRHYQVPAGAYPTSAPYDDFASTTAPETNERRYSSTGGELLARGFTTRGFTTRSARRQSGGVGGNFAIRHTSAPGEMGRRSGGYGGMNVVDEQGTKDNTGSLSERNPPPDGQDAEEFSKAGLDGAWKPTK